MGTMRTITAASLAATITAQSAHAQVIASCGSFEGYGYYGAFGQVWVRDAEPGAVIFVGSDKVEDVRRKYNPDEETMWSAKKLGASVTEIYRYGFVRQILIRNGPITELYALDTESKIVSLIVHNSGFLRRTSAFAGTCE